MSLTIIDKNVKGCNLCLNNALKKNQKANVIPDLPIYYTCIYIEVFQDVRIFEDGKPNLVIVGLYIK